MVNAPNVTTNTQIIFCVLNCVSKQAELGATVCWLDVLLVNCGPGCPLFESFMEPHLYSSVYDHKYQPPRSL